MRRPNAIWPILAVLVGVAVGPAPDREAPPNTTPGPITVTEMADGVPTGRTAVLWRDEEGRYTTPPHPRHHYVPHAAERDDPDPKHVVFANMLNRDKPVNRDRLKAFEWVETDPQAKGWGLTIVGWNGRVDEVHETPTGWVAIVRVSPQLGHGPPRPGYVPDYGVPEFEELYAIEGFVLRYVRGRPMPGKPTVAVWEVEH